MNYFAPYTSRRIRVMFCSASDIIEIPPPNSLGTRRADFPRLISVRTKDAKIWRSRPNRSSQSCYNLYNIYIFLLSIQCSHASRGDQIGTVPFMSTVLRIFFFFRFDRLTCDWIKFLWKWKDSLAIAYKSTRNFEHFYCRKNLLNL